MGSTCTVPHVSLSSAKRYTWLASAFRFLGHLHSSLVSWGSGTIRNVECLSLYRSRILIPSHGCGSASGILGWLDTTRCMSCYPGKEMVRSYNRDVRRERSSGYKRGRSPRIWYCELFWVYDFWCFTVQDIVNMAEIPAPTPITEWPDYAVDPNGGNVMTTDLNALYDKGDLCWMLVSTVLCWYVSLPHIRIKDTDGQ
jgi:hypothetical protein